MDNLLELETPTEEEPLEQPAEGADEAAELEGEQEQVEVTSLFDVDGKKVAKPIRDTLAKLKTENNPAAKLITDAVYRFGELKREFPGGLSEVRELRNQVEKWGGTTEIESAIQTAGMFAEMAKAFENSDPAFVDDMVESDPEAFGKLAPMVFDRFREVNAEGWSAYLGRIVYGDLQKNDIPLALMRLSDLIKDKPDAVQLLGTINEYLGGYKALADKAPAATTAKPKAATNNDGQRESDLRAKEWNLDRKQVQSTIRTESLTKALAGRKPTTEEAAQIEELFGARAGRLADSYFKGWREKSQAYIKRNDKAGYMRYMESIYRRIIPEAMASAVASTLKGQRAGTGTPVKRTPSGTPLKAADGFSPVAQEPDTWAVDFNRTSQAMLRENKAVLKDGKKVVWR